MVQRMFEQRSVTYCRFSAWKLLRAVIANNTLTNLFLRSVSDSVRTAFADLGVDPD